MCVSKTYIELLNTMNQFTLNREKEAIVNILSHTSLNQKDFYILLKKLELIHHISSQNMKLAQ